MYFEEEIGGRNNKNEHVHERPSKNGDVVTWKPREGIETWEDK